MTLLESVARIMDSPHDGRSCGETHLERKSEVCVEKKQNQGNAFLLNLGVKSVDRW